MPPRLYELRLKDNIITLKNDYLERFIDSFEVLTFTDVILQREYTQTITIGGGGRSNVRRITYKRVRELNGEYLTLHNTVREVDI